MTAPYRIVQPPVVVIGFRDDYDDAVDGAVAFVHPRATCPSCGKAVGLQSPTRLARHKAYFDEPHRWLPGAKVGWAWCSGSRVRADYGQTSV